MNLVSSRIQFRAKRNGLGRGFLSSTHQLLELANLLSYRQGRFTVRTHDFRQCVARFVGKWTEIGS